MKTFAEILAFTLSWEGGWSNDPDDAGGATACGITEKTFKAYDIDNDGDGDCDVEDLKLITMEQVEQIYVDGYWNQNFLCADEFQASPSSLSWPMDAVAFDTAVNSGHKRAMKCLQEALCLDIDGVIGEQTANALNAVTDPLIVALNACDSRERFVRSLAKNKPSQVKFLNGWLRRINGLREFIKG